MQDRADEGRSQEGEPTGRAAPRDAGYAERKPPGGERGVGNGVKEQRNEATCIVCRG